MARRPVPLDDGIVERAVPGRHALGGVGGQLDVAQALGDAQVVGVDHASHALAHGAQVLQLGLDERARIERIALLRGVAHAGDHELRMGLHDVVLLLERLLSQLPVHGEPARVPPLGAQRLHLPRVEDAGGGLDALAQRWGTRVEVDPRAAAPRLAQHGHEVDVAGLELVVGEGSLLRHVGVAPILAVAPAVERTGEPARAGAPSLHHLHAAVPARVLEGAHLAVVGAQDQHRLVEDLVLHDIARLRDLLEPARHLPHAGPQLFGLEREELGIGVPRLRRAIGDLDGVRHRQRCPGLPIHHRHAARPPGRSVPENYANRSVQ